jgi:subtilisin family serine protease
MLVTLMSPCERAYGQEFFDCPAVPGEYIIKYRDTYQTASKQSAPVQAVVRGTLSAKKVQAYDELSPGLELIKGDVSPLQIQSKLLSPDVASRVEYIQANCLYRANEFSVQGRLRDRSAGATANNLTVGALNPGAVAGEETALTISKSMVEELEFNAGYVDEKGVWQNVDFVTEAYEVFDVSHPKDGFNDIVAVGHFETNESPSRRMLGYVTREGTGNGSFREAELRVVANIGSERPRTVRKGFINEDDREDFVVVTGFFDSGSYYVMLSDGRGGFATKTLQMSSRFDDLQIVDIDGDSRNDIVGLVQYDSPVLTPDEERVEYFLNLGGDRFSSQKRVILYHYLDMELRISDINRDGRPDIVLLGSHFFATSLAQGSGFADFTLTEFEELLLEQKIYSARSMTLDDFNDDGFPDLGFIGNINDTWDDPDVWTSGLVVILNNGGVFDDVWKPKFFDRSTSYFTDDSVLWRDINADGRVDALVARETWDKVTVLLQDPWDEEWGPSFTEDSFYDFSAGTNPELQSAYDPRGVAGVRVRLAGNAGTFQAMTDAAGAFKVSAVPAGNYRVEVLLDSYFFPNVHERTITIQNDITALDSSAIRKPLTPPVPPSSPVRNATNDYAFNSLWGLNNYGQEGGVVDVDVDAPEAWSLSRGEGVVVGVIDSGVDFDHRDLKGSMYTHVGEIPSNKIDDDKNGYIDDTYGINAFSPGAPDDENGHGTHVAGTIAATGDNQEGVVGVAPKSRILGGKAGEGVGGYFTAASILASANYIVKQKNGGINVRVVNASFGGARTCSPSEREYISAFNAAGILFVAAAGNEGEDNDRIPKSPANCDFPNVISVAAVDRYGKLADFSNYGATRVHVAAPGKNVTSLYIDDGYTIMNGTSMAAPHVSGVAALIFSKHPNLTPQQVKQALMASVKPLSGLAGVIASPGIVSASRALAHIAGGGNSSGGGNGGTGGGNSGGRGSNGGGSGGVTARGVSYTWSSVAAGKKTPIVVTHSEAMKVEARVCYSGSLAPRKKQQRVQASLKGDKVYLTPQQLRGKKWVNMAWPRSGSARVKIAGNCAMGVSGALLDSDQDGAPGGSTRMVTLKLSPRSKRR